VVIERLKAMMDERPFRPFEIHTSDGDVVRVRSADFAWIHPSGRTMFVATDPKFDTEYVIDLLHITNLAQGRETNGRRKGGRSSR
jgi:hypothetical protein